MGLRGILDYCEFVALRQPPKRVHFGWMAVNVYRHNCARARCYDGGDVVYVHAKRIRVAIHQNRRRGRADHSEGAGYYREAGDNDLSAGFDFQGLD